MREELEELYKYRELLLMLTYRDIKVRYKQSVMGLLWAVLMPVLIVMSGIVVRYAYALASHAALQLRISLTSQSSLCPGPFWSPVSGSPAIASLEIRTW